MKAPDQLPRWCPGSRWLHGAAALAVSVAAMGCSSSSSKKADRSEYGLTYAERYAKVKNIIKNSDFSQRSQFEQQLPKAKTDKEFKASSFGAKEATGMKEYARSSSAYKAKDFADAGRNSRAGEKKAHESESENRLAAKLFRAPDSRLGSKESHDSTKEFRQGGDTFATRDNRSGTTEMEKDKRPVILPSEKPTYSEDEVKRLLNK